VFWAHLTTPYLKIGGRIFALTMADSRPDPDPNTGDGLPKLTPPPDSYPAPVTAATAWWILAILTVTAAVGVYLGGWTWQTAAVTAVLVVLGTVSGIDDASRRLPAFRGQHAQAFVIAVASILLWLAPVISYAAGYALGTRRPMGKGSRTGSPRP
jgi:hypothetical protein